MLDRCCTRRWANIKPTLVQGLVLAVLSLEPPGNGTMLRDRLRCWSYILPALGGYQGRIQDLKKEGRSGFGGSLFRPIRGNF